MIVSQVKISFISEDEDLKSLLVKNTNIYLVCHVLFL